MNHSAKKIMTGLAVLLAGFVFIGFSAPESYADDGPPVESDSVILARHMHELRVEFTLEEFSDHSFNAHMTDADMDSMLQDQRITIGSAHMYYPTDSSFRIAVIEVESCGAHCNSDWYSWLHFNDGSGLVIKDVGYSEITGIYPLPDGKYLIMDSDHGIEGAWGCYGYSAEVLSFNDHKITYHDIPAVPEDEKAKEKTGRPGFGVYSCTYMPDECRLTFDVMNNSLHYSYADDPGPWDSPDSVSVYSGQLQYSDTSFVLKKSESHMVKNVTN